jgi:hypothetical protein
MPGNRLQLFTYSRGRYSRVVQRSSADLRGEPVRRVSPAASCRSANAACRSRCASAAQSGFREHVRVRASARIGPPHRSHVFGMRASYTAPGQTPARRPCAPPWTGKTADRVRQ